MEKPKRKTGGKSKAVHEPQHKMQADEKKPPFDLAKRWLSPWFTLEYQNRQCHMASRPKAFDLELLGNIAARLLTGADYIQAAHRAHMLLLACEALNYHVTNEDEALTKHIARRNESDLPEVVSFNKAITVITGQKRTDRATEPFRKLLKTIWNYRDATAQEEQMEEMKQRGFTKDYVLHLCDCFQIRLLTGELGIRKSPKNKLDDPIRSESDTKAVLPGQEG